MRAVFIGAGEITVRTAELLVKRGDEVVIIEQDRDTIDKLSESLDCGFLHGDASKPGMLKEAAPKETDVLFCLTDNDRVNIIASLIGRSLGFSKIITKIENPELEDICKELDLESTIIPSRTIARYLADQARGQDVLELSTVIKDEARFFSFKVGDGDNGTEVGDLELPDKARAVCLYRKNKFRLTEPDMVLKKDDELVVLTHSGNLEKLRERWAPEVADDV